MRVVPLLFALMMTACSAVAPGTGGKPPAAAQNPVTAGAIVVTSLDGATPGEAAAPRPKPNPALNAPNPDATKPPAGGATADGATSDGAPPKPAAKPPLAQPVAELPVAPRPEMSAAEKTCLKQGGRWGQAGKAGETCIKLTRDSGRQCDAESDCEGYCLSRSRTCAPFTPMFGCNDILQDNGVQVTLCLD